MSDITLEKIDILRERTGISYTEAKEALEECDGNVVDALIFIENKNKKNSKDDLYATKDEFISWIKETIQKGNVNRIRIKKDDKEICDIPVNAGMVAGMLALWYPPLMALGILSAVFAKITVEIVKSDGSVEVVNKIIKNKAKDVKEKVDDITFDVKEKVEDIASEMKEKFEKKNFDNKKDENVYQYTVTFEEVDEDKEDKDNENKDGR
ncbi:MULTISPECIES: DUF4342 domain-containing protein [Clostridium]|uniref:Elongation factor Ts, mitochondrial n=2 Tax=Clostridium TaxID=1485 RepID=A0A151AMG0_9CLOT|nr:MULTISPECIES: DUF4342 domain-containing protein [Clostridium]KYH28587.1 elongation factor Ts, mitochondrial [Clostridium colicanis DSM 13634]MBE6042879.1 DUF4342 domain-containing protein [Clostridium thermopalmarium]PRR74125.1 elongation factor Ts [Clostridium thermopalmarium DSM 5974]PVZ25453.1 uncharacterized protein DUF4342 [Clostridium thermopalmarium DSM 5974]